MTSMVSSFLTSEAEYGILEKTLPTYRRVQRVLVGYLTDEFFE